MARIQGDLLERSFTFAVRALGLVDQLPNTSKGWVLAKQLASCATSIGANLHEADHAFTTSDFAYKCNLAQKEAAETQYWIRLCIAANALHGEIANWALTEADELTRILRSVVKNTQCADVKPHVANPVSS